MGKYFPYYSPQKCVPSEMLRKYCTKISAPLLHRLQILIVYDINVYQINVFIYKIYSGKGIIPMHFNT